MYPLSIPLTLAGFASLRRADSLDGRWLSALGAVRPSPDLSFRRRIAEISPVSLLLTASCRYSASADFQSSQRGTSPLPFLGYGIFLAHLCRKRNWSLELASVSGLDDSFFNKPVAMCTQISDHQLGSSLHRTADIRCIHQRDCAYSAGGQRLRSYAARLASSKQSKRRACVDRNPSRSSAEKAEVARSCQECAADRYSRLCRARFCKGTRSVAIAHCHQLGKSVTHSVSNTSPYSRRLRVGG
jgi:hypothetical protein